MVEFWAPQPSRQVLGWTGWAHGLQQHQLESVNNIMRIWAQRIKLAPGEHASAGGEPLRGA